MSHLSDDQLGELLTAYVDGEVDPREKAFVEHLLREDRRAAGLLAELRGLSTAVGQLPRHAAPTMIAEDIRQLVERDQLLAGPAFAPAEPRHRAPSRRWTAALAMAAMIGMASAAVLYFQSQQRIFENVNSKIAMNTSPTDTMWAREVAPTPKRAEELPRPPEPPSEETLTRFVDEVLALAGSDEGGIAGDTPAATRASTPAPVVELGLSNAGGSIDTGQVASVDAALNKATRGTGISIDSKIGGNVSQGLRDGRQQMEQTWTLHIPVSQLPKVAEAVIAVGDTRSRITLAAGKANVGGEAGAKEALKRVDQAWKKQQNALVLAQRKREEQEAPAAAATGSARDDIMPSAGPFAGLFKIIGVPEGLALLGPPAPTEPTSDNASAPKDGESAAADRLADADTLSGADKIEFKKAEAAVESDSKAKTAVAERMESRDDVVPGSIVRRQLDKLREAPTSPPALSTPSPLAAAMEKYVTLVITVSDHAVLPDNQPVAPALGPAPAPKPNGSARPVGR